MPRQKPPTPREPADRPPARSRSHSLFDDESAGNTEAVVPTLPFREHLRQTPATPLSSGVKLLLGAVGLVVVLLLLAALARGVRPKKGGRPGRAGVGAYQPSPSRSSSAWSRSTSQTSTTLSAPPVASRRPESS